MVDHADPGVVWPRRFVRMYIEVDLSVVPPAIALHEPDDFTSFKVTVRPVEHAWVQPEAIRALAGSRGEDPEWQRGLDAMLDYARDHGWIRDGAVRAHVDMP